MKTSILIAVDWSKSAMNAVQYVADLLKNQKDVSITLLHVFKPYPYVPPLESAPSESREKYGHEKKSWEETEREHGEKCLARALTMLMDAGFAEQRIQLKNIDPILPEHDTALEILKESEQGNYDTIVLGKRGVSRVQVFLTGSVTEKIVRHAKGHAVWVIE
jgi:nucleotide-binding universal stress UspA family protein